MTKPTPPPSDNHIERNHHPIPLPAIAKNAPARLFIGGSFDPPHLAHTELPTLAAQQLDISLGLMPHSCCLVYVPTARSPHKETTPTPDQHRVEMLQQAILSVEQPACIWTQELDDGLLNLDEPSYWADTWSIIRLMLTTGINHFLIGTDQALSMHRWHRYTEFWRDAVVILREDGEPESTVGTLIHALQQTGAWTDDDLHHWEQSCIEIKTMPHSSTALRKQLSTIDRSTKNKKPRIEGLDPGVVEYILQNDLYDQNH